ncbi:MAG: peptidase inhibitor family I36 protein [Bifidobacteriaceae bacterium]|jgi:hypothetical protein|nr:peptidase inhibitor family I36 protein [Bifidobacteriaceae bacterium]
MRRILVALFAVAAGCTVAATGPATAAPAPTIAAEIDAGDVPAKATTGCPSGAFCMWTGSGYSGAMSYRTGSGLTHSIGESVGSFWNNRSGAARLYSNGGTSSTCHPAGAKKASLTSAYGNPAKVYLSASTSC